jgi:hypothetical protein
VIYSGNMALVIVLEIAIFGLIDFSWRAHQAGGQTRVKLSVFPTNPAVVLKNLDKDNEIIAFATIIISLPSRSSRREPAITQRLRWQS